MQKQVVGVIGNSKMVMDCLRHLLTLEGVTVAFVFYDPKLETPTSSVKHFCDNLGLSSYPQTNINAPTALEIVASAEPDWILNINSYKIIKTPLLNMPKKGLVNFHNGPLPKYGGVHIPNWCIIKGEKKHGVTWHFVEETIDTGDIIFQSIFELEEDITASQLMAKCVMEGIALFKSEIHHLFEGSYKRIPQQSLGTSSYFSLKDMPDNEGVIDFRKDYDSISRLVRGLNMLPLQNDFVYARFPSSDSVVILNEVSYVGPKPESVKAGTLVGLDKQHFHVACADAILAIEDSMNTDFDNYEPLELAEILKVSVGDSVIL